MTDNDLQQLAGDIKRWANELGFQQAGITDADPGQHSAHLRQWLEKGFHGEMHYMAEREALRRSPQKLHADTIRVISLRMDYLPTGTDAIKMLDQPEQAYISRYALGRDYHKLVRKRASQLATRIADKAGYGNQRPFVDSAPVLERGFAEKAGLGWIGKNTMLINSSAGSWFFLAELFTDIPLPVDLPGGSQHCGSCTACLDICPTDAFTGPFQLDARKCISYLTIELKGPVPLELRPKIGNRVFGCDDCQLVCPWNKFAMPTEEKDFTPRHKLDNSKLVDLFLWSEEEFDQFTQGSAIRRIGYECWLRNLAIGLGNIDIENDPARTEAVNALKQRQNIDSSMVREHIEWALQQLAQT